MNRLIKKPLVKLWNTYFKYTKGLKKYFKIKLGQYSKYEIVRFETISSKVKVIKEKTHEKIMLFKIFEGIAGGEFYVDFPEICLWKFRDATVYYMSDFVVAGEKCVWPKFFHYNYTKNIPLDKMLIKEEDGSLYVSKPYKLINIENAYSLIGAHCDVWSHNLSEYFTKLVALPDILKDLNGKELHILIPKYKDKQLAELIYSELSQFPNIKPLIVPFGTAIRADNLYYMERPSRFNDHSKYVEIGDSVQPQFVADTIKKKIVAPYLDKYYNNSCDTGNKLYLARRGAYRNLINFKEVEEFFASKGFKIIEPHKLSLGEKICVFRNADYVVGPFSSAFSNIIFCKPGTKALMLSNYSRPFEGWLMMHQQHFDIDFMVVTGHDFYKKSIPHCNYYISIDRIEKACKEHGIEI